MTDSHTNRMQPKPSKKRLQSARRVALEALSRVERRGAYANLILNHLLGASGLSARERALATELTYGTLRNRGWIDWLLSHFVKRPWSAQHPMLRNLLRLAAYQILYLDTPPHAVCSESVALARAHPATRHATGFVNAVCRAFARGWQQVPAPRDEGDRAEYLAITTSHPPWLLRRWIEQMGEEQAERYALANTEPAPTVLRVNTLRTTPDELTERIRAEGVTVTPSPVLPGALRIAGSGGIERLAAFREGLCTAQDESSQLVTWILDPQPGSVIADVCSAPGSKTTHMAEWMGDTGSIWAFDLHPKRLQLVEQACRRLHIESIRTQAHDARELAGRLESCDAILVDAPCTGTGVLRRRPDLRWSRTADDLSELIPLQREILTSVAPLVRPGGTLVYSTCSVDAAENGENVAWFLEQHPKFLPEGFYDRLPAPLVDSLTSAQSASARQGQLQLWPHHNQTDGFFIAKFRRQL